MEFSNLNDRSARAGAGPEPFVDREIPASKTIVVGPYLPNEQSKRPIAPGARPNTKTPFDDRTGESRLEEANSLAAAIGLEIVKSVLAPLKTVRPATYIGKGRLQDISALVAIEDVSVVIVDAQLSPVQQRNLENDLKAKVLDRTGLILEIFGDRAQTKEGVLQVEHAHLSYQKSRLVRSWTHLERQRGGFGFLGGPGETQIEADRRMIQDRLNRIERDLEAVRKMRKLHRDRRTRSETPVIALVGYTNAGKSTLFNHLTEAETLAKDLLFATLDPTMRATSLPDGQKVVFSDTVGFVSDLPTHLVAAFRATLEEVMFADLILHVRDIAHPDSEAQKSDVLGVLETLGIDVENEQRIIEVWNKIDLLDHEAHQSLLNQVERRNKTHGEGGMSLVSARTGEGVDALHALISSHVAPKRQLVDVTLFPTEGRALNFLYERAQIIARSDSEDGTVSVHIEIPKADMVRFMRQFPELTDRICDLTEPDRAEQGDLFGASPTLQSPT